METTTVMLCGVGGQGTILAADLLAKVAAMEGYNVKLSEVHGMSQRGGAVDTVVRFGSEVFSPVTDTAQVDHLVAFEIIEARRQLPHLKRGGVLLVNDLMMKPLGSAGKKDPVWESVASELRQAGAIFIDAASDAIRAGSPRSANVVLVGALSAQLPFKEDSWRAVITTRVPAHTVDANLEAFTRGRTIISRQED